MPYFIFQQAPKVYVKKRLKRRFWRKMGEELGDWDWHIDTTDAHAQWLQPCPTLCDPVDCSPPGSSVRGISQAKILEWVAFSYSREFSPPRDRTGVSYIGRQSLCCRDNREGYTLPILCIKQITNEKVKSLSRVRLFVTPWTVAYQASPSMGFSRQGYWSGLPLVLEYSSVNSTQCSAVS